MDKFSLKNALKEMFPKLSSNKIDQLVSTGDDINILITRILDNNIDGLTVDLKDVVRNPRSCESYKHQLNYPEVFEKRCNIDMHEDVNELRKKASMLSKAAAEYSLKARTHEIKECRPYFGIESDNVRENAKPLNRHAASIIMRRAIESNGPIDLHGLHVDEALSFVEDLYNFYNFKEIKLITGQKYKSLKVRPAITNWLIDHDFTVVDEGPIIRAVKNIN